jgi:hypothetical protein
MVLPYTTIRNAYFDGLPGGYKKEKEKVWGFLSSSQ